MIISALQIIVEDDGRCNGIDTRLVAAVTLLHTAVDHCLVGYRAGEALVIHHYGHVRQFLFQAVDKGGDVLHAFAGFAVELCGFANNDPVHRVMGDIVLDELHERMGRHCGQIARNNLQRVGHSHTSALAPIVDAHDASHSPQ